MTTGTNQVTPTTRRRSEEADAAPAAGAGDTAQAGSFLAEIRGGGAAAGGEGQPETPILTRPRRKFPTQHLVTLLVVIAGGGALVAMRQYGMGAGMRFDNAAKIDYIEPVVQKRTPEQQRILTDLERGVTATAPQAADIQKNPFRLVVSAPTPIEVAAGPAPDDSAQRSAEAKRQRQGQLEEAITGVALNSVMGGDVPLARVNGEIVRVGDTVAELFTVTAIQGRSILLSADGQLFIVEMSQESAPKPPSSPRSRTSGR